MSHTQKKYITAVAAAATAAMSKFSVFFLLKLVVEWENRKKWGCGTSKSFKGFTPGTNHANGNVSHSTVNNVSTYP